MIVRSATKALFGLLVLMSLGASGQLAAQALPSDSAQVLSADSAVNRNIDYRVLKTIQLHRTSFGNSFWVPLSNTFVLSVLPSPVMLVGSLSASGTTSAGIPRSTALQYDAAQAGATLLLNAAVTMGLKSLVGRPRPYVTYQGDLVCLQKVASSSFRRCRGVQPHVYRCPLSLRRACRSPHWHRQCCCRASAAPTPCPVQPQPHPRPRSPCPRHPDVLACSAYP